MFTEIILSSWLRLPQATNENILTEKLLEEVEDDATRFAILNNFLEVSVEQFSAKLNFADV